MSKISLTLTALFLVLLPAMASAADPITVTTSTNEQLPVSGGTSADWSGFYAGIYGALNVDPSGDTQPQLGFNLGVNAQVDFYLLGGEVTVQGLPGDVDETTHGQILGRAGLVVSDDVAVYAAGGYGLDLNAPDDGYVLAGGGLELSVTDDVSLRAQYLRSFPVQDGEPGGQFSLGATYHF